MQSPELIVDYAPRPQFVAFHERRERFACIVTHRRAGKTVACVHELQRAAIRCEKARPRFAYLAPFLKQSKAVAWDYLRDAVSLVRPLGATVHESELRVDYPEGGQVRLYGADNPDAMRGIYLDGIVLDEYADMDPRVDLACRRRVPVSRDDARPAGAERGFSAGLLFRRSAW